MCNLSVDSCDKHTYPSEKSNSYLTAADKAWKGIKLIIETARIIIIRRIRGGVQSAANDCKAPLIHKVWSSRYDLQTAQHFKRIYCLSSGPYSKWSKKAETSSKLCPAYSWTLKMEEICSSEMSGPSVNYITIHRTIFPTVTFNATSMIHIIETDVMEKSHTITGSYSN